MISFPKVTDKGTKSAEIGNQTIHPDNLPTLLFNYFKVLPVTLVPLDMSKSPDTIIGAQVNYNGKKRKLVIGLSMKKYTGKQLGKTLLEHEYNLFVNCFKRLKQNYLKILIIFCTKFCKEFEKQLENNFFFCHDQKNSEIDEIIVLNLTTREMRSLFFGPMKAKMSDQIEKILQKE